MNIQRPDEWLSALQLPMIGEIKSYELQARDLLVTCAGFEDRAFEFLRRVVKRGARGFTVIAIDYLPSVSANRGEELESCTRKGGAELSWVTYNRQDPLDPSDLIFARLKSTGRLVIDISGMSRLLIVQLVCAAIRSQRLSDVHLVYSEAKRYPPTKKEVEAAVPTADELFGVINFISSGVFGIIVPPELSTVSMYGQPIRLVAFPSFNPTQFAALFAEVNASSYTIVHGIPPGKENAWRTDAIRKLNKVELLREAEEYATSTLDYRETVDLLLKVYQRYGDREKLVIAPIGSKMQSVAVGIVVGFLRDLQVVYPAPRSFPFPENYTKGVKRIYGVALRSFAEVLKAAAA